jgi:hypothetical protein
MHRDPDTGQFVSGVDRTDLEYASHEFQNIRVGGISPLGDDSDGADERQYEPLGGDLMNNELAELVGFERSFGVDIVEVDTEQSQQNFYGGKAELSINTDGDERLTSDNRNPAFFSEDGPEFLDVAAPGVSVGPFVNSAAGAGGGGGGGFTSDKVVNYQEMTGGGPFLDKADNLSIRVEAEADNCLHHIQAVVYYKLYWRVYEMENSRPTFGSPGDD